MMSFSKFMRVRRQGRLGRSRRTWTALTQRGLAALIVWGVGVGFAAAQTDKPEAIRDGVAQGPRAATFATPQPVLGSGHRITVGEGATRYPLAVVRGTPYEMGYHLGRAFGEEIRQFVPAAVAGISQELHVEQATLQGVWARSAAYADDRVEQELVGVADGAGVPLAVLQAMHAVPLLMPYSCSSIAAWGEATADAHLYQTRNLDWALEIGAHNFPMIVLYIPDQGIPHVVPSFAGMIGAHTGMNARGVALAEMGDASRKEMPYLVHAPHFTVLFRTLLYDGDSLTKTLDLFQSSPHTKRYHYVFGDGQTDCRAVKIRAHMPEAADQRVVIWTDNDPRDEFAPNVRKCVVYNDEGRGAFPLIQQDYGQLNGERMLAIANHIPIQGGNVENVIYDATALRMWVSYAKDSEEAYKRPYTFVDLRQIDADGDGQADLK